jgi:hypothetical protein
MLDCLVVAIGWLYWGTLNCFYKKKGLKMPTIYSNNLKYALAAAVLCMGGVVAVALAVAIVQDPIMVDVLNWLVLGSTVVAMTFFVVFRIVYYRNIFSSVKMRRRVVRLEIAHNVIIVLASMSRVTLCILDALEVDFE